MAAALLAALFAMGVFAPAGVEATVKGGSDKPQVTWSSTKHNDKDVTLTVKFRVTDDVDRDGNNVVVTLPVGVLSLADDNVSVKQGGKNVGSITTTAGDATTAATITIGVPADDSSNENLRKDALTTLRVTGLSTPTAASSATFLTIGQPATDAATSADSMRTYHPVTFSPSVTSASASISNNDPGKEGVTLTVKFKADTASSDSVASGTTVPDNNPVVITLDELDYNLDFYEDAAASPAIADNNGLIEVDDPTTTDKVEGEGIGITVTGAKVANNGATPALVSVINTALVPASGTDPAVPAKNAITIYDFDEGATVTVKITGLTNRSGNSKEIKVSLAQHSGQVGEGTTITQTPALAKSVYITNDEEAGIMPLLDEDDEPMESILSSSLSGDDEVEMNFMFEPIVQVDDEDTSIVITLNEGFMFMDPEMQDITVWQSVKTDSAGDPVLDDDGNEIPIQVDYDVAMDADGKNIVITLNDDGKAPDEEDDENMETAPATDGETVYVRIGNLVNPFGVGEQTLATIKQGPYASIPYKEQMLGTEISTTVAGANVRIKVTAKAESNIPPGDDIVVTLTDFVLPDNISERQVIIDGAEDFGDSLIDAYDGNPSAVSISGAKINLSIPTVRLNGVDIDHGIPAGSIYTVTFKLGAGIKNPTVKQGSRSASAGGEGTGAASTEVTSKVTAGTGSASRGDLVEFKVIGLKTGAATLYLLKGMCVDALQESQGCVDHTGADVLNADDVKVSDVAGWVPEEDDFRIGGNLQADGSVSVERRVTSLLFEANMGGNGPREPVGTPPALLGTNIIYSVDGTGVLSDAHGRLAIEPVIDLGTQSIKQGGLLELDISDWHYGTITKVEVGGVLVTEVWTRGEAVRFPVNGIPASGDSEFIVVMPPGVRLGEQQLKLTGTTTEEKAPSGVVDSYTTKIEVDPLDLEIETPTRSADGLAEVAVNQEFTIEGSGFTTADNAHIASVKFGDVVFRETTAGVCVGCFFGEILRPDTAGNFSATFRLEPRFGAAQLKVGEYRIEVKDSEGRIGQVDVVVPEPVVETQPSQSRRGSTVTVIGSKFPAGAELAVNIKYGLAGNERTIASATPDSSGNWRATFTVPTTAIIGQDHVVLAEPIEPAFSHFKGKGVHRLPEQEVIVTPGKVAAGGRMTIEGHNMPLFTRVYVYIANIRVVEGGVETDGVGSFMIPNVLVPQLEPGFHTIEALVQTQGDRAVTVRTSVEIADIVTRPTTEVFEELIEAGQLESVWRYQIDETGSDWDSFDPQYIGQPGINDLEFVSTNDIVWIRVSANTTFQGASLFAGWNLRTLE